MKWYDYRQACKKFATYPKANELEYLILGYFNEVGELLGAFKKAIRGDYGASELAKKIKAEAGDCFWYLAMLENIELEQGGFDYEEFLEGSMLKTFLPDYIHINEEKRKLFNLLHDFGIEEEYVWQANIEKLQDRLDRNVIKGSGDER